MYGMAQPAQYGQYGAYPGWGAAGTGMPSPQPTTGETAVAVQGAGAADPNAYYNNYWGGEQLLRSSESVTR
jgi:hypothetical protein